MKFFSFIIVSLFVSVGFSQSLFDSAIDSLLKPDLKPFYFGVASGDPHQTNVIIWTKVWAKNKQDVKVKWQVASDTSIQNIVAQGVVEATVSSAYTVKVLVESLMPGTTYFYRFESDGFYSPIGRTKTAPVSADSIKFAVVSCNNYQNGYYNVFRLIANRNDVDAVIHLGDYIYEGGSGTKKGKFHVRSHIPPREILTLQDYRTRHAQYRLDEDLQEVHRLHPFICEWDDHEFANDAYKEGAKNHKKEKGEWSARITNAKQAYFEWLPITSNVDYKITRKISYGNLAEIFMLDTRTEERCKQVNPFDSLLSCETRTILGKTQTAWLRDGIIKSAARWKVMANQVVFSELDAHHLSKSTPINTDAWDGYPIERKELMDSFYKNNIKNVIVITGDIHLSWGFDLVQNPKDKSRYNAKTGLGVIGAEFVTPSVSSAGFEARAPKAFAPLAGSILKRKSTNPHMRYQDLVKHGYILLDLNEDRAKATWIYTKTVAEKTDKYTESKSYITKYNANRLVKEK